MNHGLLMVKAISHGAALAALVAADCDIGQVAYEMELLGDQAGQALSPAARAVPPAGPAG